RRSPLRCTISYRCRCWRVYVCTVYPRSPLFESASVALVVVVVYFASRNVLTASFVETSIFKLAFAMVGMVGMGPAAEESLGHVGLAIFLLVVSLAAGLITSTGTFVAYIVTRQEYLLDLELHGSFGLLAGLGVAAAQQSPEGSLLPDGYGPWFPKRYFPLLLLTVSAVGRALSVPVMSDDFPFVFVGGYAAWVYLRFFAHM
ncbi:unnamed protein product, partial [Laminaria digitata]